MLMSKRDEELRALVMELVRAEALKNGAKNVAERVDNCFAEAIDVLDRVDGFFYKKRLYRACAIAQDQVREAVKDNIPAVRSLIANLLDAWEIEKVAGAMRNDDIPVEDWARLISAKILDEVVAGIPAARAKWAEGMAFDLMTGKAPAFPIDEISGVGDQEAVVDAMIARLANIKGSATENQVTDQMQINAVEWSKTLPHDLLLKFMNTDVITHAPALKELVAAGKSRFEKAMERTDAGSKGDADRFFCGH